MDKIIRQHKEFWKDRHMIRSFLLSCVMLAVSMILNFYIGRYATVHASNAVTDIVLSNTRAYDVDGIFVYGAFAYFIFIIVYCIRKPFQTPYIIKAIALFVVIRCVFVSITHIGPYPIRSIIESNVNIVSIFNKISFTGDLFFSGHTGLPFLMALIFRQNKRLRYIFFVASVFFGVVVLLGHLHYSIDVLAAFFITYSIYHISLVFFKKDKKHFDKCMAS